MLLPTPMVAWVWRRLPRGIRRLARLHNARILVMRRTQFYGCDGNSSIFPGTIIYLDERFFVVRANENAPQRTATDYFIHYRDGVVHIAHRPGVDRSCLIHQFDLPHILFGLAARVRKRALTHAALHHTWLYNTILTNPIDSLDNPLVLVIVIRGIGRMMLDPIPIMKKQPLDAI